MDLQDKRSKWQCTNKKFGCTCRKKPLLSIATIYLVLMVQIRAIVWPSIC